MSKANIEELQKGSYEFILGARIKNESKEIKEAIFSLNLSSGESEVIEKNDLKLIISHSDKRAKKDKHNKEQGLKRLERLIKTGKLTKSSINNRGYNKYLKMEGDVKISIDKKLFN